MRDVSRLAQLIPASAVDRQLVERSPESLHAFVRVAWSQVEPKRPFVDGRVLHVICDFLEAMTRREIRKAVINCPPGFMKSLLTGVFWPAWEWITDSTVRSLYGSYDGSLTLRDAKKTFDLIASPWFRERWGERLRSYKQPYSDYFTIDGGNRFSTSVGGKGTGRHFEKHIADDPIKPKDALGGATFSETILNTANDWWDQTIGSRTADYETLLRLIIMQRLHDNDPSGHVLETGDYTHLRIPMRYEDGKCCVQIPHPCIEDWRKRTGDLAWVERFNHESVGEAERQLRVPTAIAAQMQQSPAVKGGSIFKEQDFLYWHPVKGMRDPKGKPCLLKPLIHGQWFQSWDLTFKDSEGTDSVSGGVWQGVGSKLYLHDRINSQMSFTDTLRAVKRTSMLWPQTMRKVIENKANGPACENVLKKHLNGITLVEPMGDKVARASACTTFFEAGDIVFPHPDLCPWVTEYVAQLLKFPFAKHDDDVDMTSQAIIDYMKRRNKLSEAMRNVDLESIGL